MKRRGEIASLGEAYETIRADYDAAKSSRFQRSLTGYVAGGSSADYHIRSSSSYFKIMESARAIDRNDQVVGQGVTRLVRNVLQDGVMPDPNTGNSDADKYILDKFCAWACDRDACDIEGEKTLHGIAKLVLRARIVDGDIFELLTRSGHIQTMEGHRCQTPSGTKRNVVHGVLMDENRRRLQYWFTKEEIGLFQAAKRVGDMAQVDARDPDGNRQVLHIYDPKRMSLTRGVSAFAPITNTVGFHDDIQFATLVKQQASACLTFMRTRSDDMADPAATGAQSTETQSDGTSRIISGIGPGLELIGAPGEEIKGFSPGIPSNEFFQHAKLILTFIAINLDIPLVVLLLDASETNFSGFRGALEQARTGWRAIQRDMIEQFYRPIYEWKLRQWLTNDEYLQGIAARPDVDIFHHDWTPPTWPYIEPNKDATADALIIERHLNSHRDTLLKRGIKIEEMQRDIIDDNKRFILMAVLAAQEIEQETGAAVDWREILTLPVVSPVSVVSESAQPPEQPQGQPNER